MALRTPVIAGNWKMHMGPSAAREFVSSFLAAYPARTDRTIILFPPAVSLTAVHDGLAARPDVQLGAQNIFWEETGAFTGEMSAGMAADAGAAFALVGHSERRHVFGETIEDTRRKTHAALGAGLTPILCVGETLDERKGGRADAVVTEQLVPILETLSGQTIARLAIAYEPVWAIGTGETASPADAGAMHGVVRELLSRRFGADAEVLPVLYGGSVKPGNAGLLLAEPEVNGVLVGGASLDAAGFAAICAAST